MKRHFLLLILFLSWSWNAGAQSLTREVELELDPVEGASSYELRFQRQGQSESEAEVFSWAGAKGSVQLKPGLYKVFVRSLDDRRVSSNWGYLADLTVLFPSVDLIAPTREQSLIAKNSAQESVRFEWIAPEKSSYYRLQVRNAAQALVVNEKTSDFYAVASLAPGQGYEWRVEAYVEGHAEGQPSQWQSFNLRGARLKPPQIEAPQHTSFRAIIFRRPERAQSVSYRLLLKKSDGSFQLIEEKKDFIGERITMQSDFPEGTYQLVMQADAPLTESSEPAQLEFLLASSLSQEEYEDFLMRSFFKSDKEMTFIASYMITMMELGGVNKESNTRVSDKAVGGTGRLGVSKNPVGSPWSYSGLVDLSGYTIGPQTVTFAAAEARLNWSYLWKDRHRLQLTTGVYMKELPEIIGMGRDGIYSTQKVTSLGILAGLEYRYVLGPQYAMMTEFLFYNSALGGTAPNGQAVIPQLSHQFSVMGSKKLGADITGLMGYALRVDRSQYRALPGDPMDPDSLSLAQEGDHNLTTITGGYLRFDLEWKF